MGINKGMMSSDRQDWRTPRDLFDSLNNVFCFDLDAAASKENHLCRKFFDLSNSAFDNRWFIFGSSAFLNPPYGRGIEKWVDLAIKQAVNRVSVVALVPSRTDTKWFHALWDAADHMLFFKGRLRFDDGKNCAPFPSALAILNRGLSATEKGVLMQMGRVF